MPFQYQHSKTYMALPAALQHEERLAKFPVTILASAWLKTRNASGKVSDTSVTSPQLTVCTEGFAEK